MFKAVAIGNLGQDAKIKEVNGKLAIQFSIAVNEAFTNKDNVKVEKTTWINCTMWRDNANKTKVAEFLKKGTQVHIEFKPSVNIYQNDNGVHQAAINANVTGLTLLGSAKKEDNGNNQPNQPPAPINQEWVPEEETNGMPF